MDETVVHVERLDLKDDPRLLSPPWLVEPLYQCATAVTVLGFVAHAKVEVELDGASVVSQTVGFPEPVGATLALPAPLVAGQKARVRQESGGHVSDWSPLVEVRVGPLAQLQAGGAACRRHRAHGTPRRLP